MTYDVAPTVLMTYLQGKDINAKEAAAVIIKEAQNQRARNQALEQRNKMLMEQNADLKAELDECHSKNVARLSTIEALDYAADVVQFITKGMDANGVKTVVDLILAELHDRK